MKKLAFLILLTLNFVPLKSQIYDSSLKSGMTTLHGSIKNHLKYYEEFNKIEIQVSDWTNGRRRTYFSNIDSAGKFSTSFFIFSSQEVILIYKNNVEGLFVNPDDTLFLTISADEFPEKTEYTGKTANACNTLDTFYNYQDSIFKISKSRINMRMRDSLQFSLYHHWRDSVYKTEMKNLDAFSHKIQPDASLRQYFIANTQLHYYWDLLNYRSFRRDSKSKDPVIIINSIQIDTLKYDIKRLPIYPFVVNQLYMKVHELMTINYNKDHPIIINREKMREKKPVSMPPLPSLSEREQSCKRKFPYYIKSADIIENNELRESVLAHYYSVLLEQNIDIGLDSILKYISIPDIKSTLIHAFNSFKLKKTNQTSLTVESNLIDELASKFKGHVLYVDFWGTWCGPCYESFKSVSAIKNALKDQKIVFVYLCCRCNKEEWESAIKKYHLDGDHIFLTSEQLQLLSRDFNLIGVPKYIIVDPDGRIVNDNALRPSSDKLMQEQLINQLKSYL